MPSHHNRTINLKLAALALTSLGISLTGCYWQGGSTPQAALPPTARDFSLESLQQSVLQRQEWLSAPLSLQVPDRCQSVPFQRFHAAMEADGSPYQRATADADAILIFQPGLLSGANVFTLLAENLVYRAGVAGKRIEVLVLDRRDQCLADLRGLNAAEQARDPNVALNYYYRQAEIDGQRFSGFLTSDQVPFLAEFGLQQTLSDLMALIEYAVPDQQARQQKLFVGGHSLGGNLTSAFMGWDFDGNRLTLDDAGYNQAAGFIRLDISLTPKEPGNDPWLVYGRSSIIADPTDRTNRQYQSRLQALRNGRESRFVAFPGVDAEAIMLLEVASMLARWQPDAEATLLRDWQFGTNANLLLRLIHSRNTSNFVSNKPGIREYRYTNEALLGVIFDNDFLPISILQAGLGFLDGPVLTKTFPNNDGIRGIAGMVDPFLRFLLTDGRLYIAGDAGVRDNLGSGPLYRWINFDQVGDASRPELRDLSGHTMFTHVKREVTDIQDLARIIHQGEGSFAEWYMSQRIVFELEQLQQPALIEGLPFWHAQMGRTRPILEIVGTESFIDLSVEPLSEFYIAEGYAHMDILTAAADRSARRPNEVVGRVLDFIIRQVNEGSQQGR